MTFDIRSMFPDIKPEVVETEIIDRSRAEKRATCPFQGYWCEQRPESTNKLCQVGQEVHSVAESVLREVLESGDFESLPMELADKLLSARPDIQPAVLQAARNLLKLISQTAGGKVLRDSNGDPFIEKQIDCNFIPTQDGRPVKLTTCLDFARYGQQENIIVTDWKGGYKKRSNSEAQESFQAQFIGYVLWQLFPKIDRIDFWYDETRWGTQAYARFDRKQIVIGEITQEQAIKSRIFEACKLIYADCRECWPTPEKCCWCDAVMDCLKADAPAKALSENPAEWVDNIAALQAKIDKMTDYAGEYVKSHGAIKGTNCIFEWKPSKPKFTPKLYSLADGDNSEKTGELSSAKLEEYKKSWGA